MKIYSIAIVLAGALFATVSCVRDGSVGESRELVVDVQMSNSDWTTRAGANGGAASGAQGSAVALDQQLEIVAEYGTQDTLLTRGTPLDAPSQLKSIGFAVYVNSVFNTTCTATNTAGVWSIANNIVLNLGKKYSYYAYAPVVAADNGIVVQADGKKLTYTAPTDITKQPDLCWATPIIDDQKGQANFEMQHALTAVGLRVRADSVEIQSIKLLEVNTAGTLDLTSGAWSGLGKSKDLEFTLTNNKPATGNGELDIVGSDGYLMLPPQALVGDGKKLEIVYKYNGDTDWRTGTHQLSKITDGDWLAGQKVSYVVQLKSNFALTLTPASAMVPYTAGSYTFGYTTGSSAPSIDPTATCSDSWITGLMVNRGTGKISFNYTQNPSKAVPRKATIKVTSGFMTKPFTFTQGTLYVNIGGTLWTTTNLTGNAGTNTGHRMEANPQDKGGLFKWGSTFVYDRINSTSDGGGWGGQTTGAATSPSSISARGGYDYGLGLGGGLNPGDPCKKLGANYQTPTITQWMAVTNTSFSDFTTYQGSPGYFFGPSAKSCNNTTIEPGCIFLPLGGHRDNYTGLFAAERCNYWSSSVSTIYTPETGVGLYFSNNRVYMVDIASYDWRGTGNLVRCIYVP